MKIGMNQLELDTSLETEQVLIKMDNQFIKQEFGIQLKESTTLNVGLIPQMMIDLKHQSMKGCIIK